MHSEITASAEPREVPYAKRWQRSGGLQCPCIYRIGHCRNVRGLRKNVFVFRFFENLRYSNELNQLNLRVSTTNRSIWRRKMEKW